MVSNRIQKIKRSIITVSGLILLEPLLVRSKQSRASNNLSSKINSLFSNQYCSFPFLKSNNSYEYDDIDMENHHSMIVYSTQNLKVSHQTALQLTILSQNCIREIHIPILCLSKFSSTVLDLLYVNNIKTFPLTLTTLLSFLPLFYNQKLKTLN